MDQSAIGRRIKQRRLSLELQQGDVIERLQRDGLLRKSRGDVERDAFSVSHLSRLERGRAGDLKFEDLRALARVLETSVDWLVDGDDPNLSRAIDAFGPVESVAKALTNISILYQSASEPQRRHIEGAFQHIAQYLREHGSDPEPLEIAIIVPHEPQRDGVTVPLTN